MKLALGLVLALAVAAPAHADLSINDSSGPSAHDCGTDPNVSLNASSMSLTLTGACEKVSINGSGTTVSIESALKVSVNGAENAVSVDAADKISVNGTKNTVTYKGAVTKKKPKVSKTGFGNSVKRVK